MRTDIQDINPSDGQNDDQNIEPLELLHVWDDICREGGCSAEQLRELHQPAPDQETETLTYFQEWSPTQELDLEDVPMWLGKTPARPLN